MKYNIGDFVWRPVVNGYGIFESLKRHRIVGIHAIERESGRIEKCYELHSETHNLTEEESNLFLTKEEAKIKGFELCDKHIAAIKESKEKF